MSAPPFFTKSGPAVKDPPPDVADFEVLPPERRGGTKQQQAVAQLIAYVMDNLIKVPGTKKTRVGINPFLDLLWVFGDGAAAGIQMLTIIEGARRGVPKAVLARMGFNVLVNGFVGMIPGVGEAFAFLYRPSTRNYQLLLKHAPQDGASPRKSTWRDWTFLFVLLGGMLIVTGVFVAMGVMIGVWLWHAVSGR